MRGVLFDRFGAAYEAGSGKRLARCARRSRLRIRCGEVSWIKGGLTCSGRITVWRAREQRRPTLRHALTIRRVDEHCLSAGGTRWARTIRDTG